MPSGVIDIVAPGLSCTGRMPLRIVTGSLNITVYPSPPFTSQNDIILEK